MHTSRIVGLLLLVIVQNMHSPLTPRPGSSKNTGSIPVATAIKIKKPPDEAGWFVNFGGGGGNRTRVQKHSTDSSTYLVLPFNLTRPTRTHTL